jgi:ribosomal protein L13E
MLYELRAFRIRREIVKYVFHALSYAPQPNESFNADANTGHGFAILLASVGALRPYGLRRRLTRALGFTFELRRTSSIHTAPKNHVNRIVDLHSNRCSRLLDFIRKLIFNGRN